MTMEDKPTMKPNRHPWRPALFLAVLALSWPVWAVEENVIVVDLATKEITSTNTVVAIRENVYTVITNLGDSAAEDLVLRIMDRAGTVYAIATNWAEDAEGNATNTVDLNTTEFVDFFTNMPPQATRSFTLAVWDMTNVWLVANDTIDVMNNPYYDGMPGPSPAGTAYVPTGTLFSGSGSTGMVGSASSENDTKVLYGDGSWGDLVNLHGVFGGDGSTGLVGSASADNDGKYLKGDGTWDTPSGVTEHNELNGLTDGDDHTQYLELDGSDAMTGDLPMGANDVTGVGTVESDYFESPSGGSGKTIRYNAGSARWEFEVGASTVYLEAY